VHNNQVYGLTRGQASPTCELGFVTRVQTHGVITNPLNPLALAVSQDASFVARGYAGNGDHLKELIKEGILNPGFSLIDILQPCVSFDHRHSYQWYEKRVYPLDKKYNPHDKYSAYKAVEEWGEKIPLGILYKKERATFEHQQQVLNEKALIEQKPDSAIIKPLIDAFL
jgi:2-oxoglutarate ferredoxin oxidoreductase subunit beta